MRVAVGAAVAGGPAGLGTAVGAEVGRGGVGLSVGVGEGGAALAAAVGDRERSPPATIGSTCHAREAAATLAVGSGRIRTGVAATGTVAIDDGTLTEAPVVRGTVVAPMAGAVRGGGVAAGPVQAVDASVAHRSKTATRPLDDASLTRASRAERNGNDLVDADGGSLAVDGKAKRGAYSLARGTTTGGL